MVENKDYKLYYNDLNNLKELTGVYLIRNLDNNKLKIGITNNLQRRLKEIKKSFQFCGVIPKLKIECFIEFEQNDDLEKFLHEEFKEFNHQNEWFSIDDINIVLDKLSQYTYIKPKVIVNNNFSKQDIKIKNTIPIKNQNYTESNYYYYLYTYKDVEFYIRHDEPNEEEKVVESIIDNIYSKVYNEWNYFHVKDDWGKIINPIMMRNLSNEVKQLFNKNDTNALAKVSENKYIPLELYFLEEYKKELIERFDKTKEIIIQKFNSNLFESNDTNNLLLNIDKIEKFCIEIQKELNNCIRYKNKQNYKRQG